MRDEITALLIAVTGLIVSQITGFVRSRRNTKRIDEAEKRVAQTDSDLQALRDKNEEDSKALQNRITQEALDRNVALMVTLREEREEYKQDRAEWRIERDEWKKERVENKKQLDLLDAAYKSIKHELEATNRELERVRNESSEREIIIQEQSKTIENQTKQIKQHEATIQELTDRVKTLEDLNAELDRLRIEALKAMPALPPAPSTTLINAVQDARRGTGEAKAIAPSEDKPA